MERAERFPIAAWLRYRIRGERAWEEGVTVNISRSGVLFHPAKELPPEALLQIRIRFPSAVSGLAPADILCWGRVVRFAEAEGSPVAAAAILRYRFKPQDG